MRAAQACCLYGADNYVKKCHINFSKNIRYAALIDTVQSRDRSIAGQPVQSVPLSPAGAPPVLALAKKALAAMVRAVFHSAAGSGPARKKA